MFDDLAKLVSHPKDWSLSTALLITLISVIAIAQGRPWSYIGWAMVIVAVGTRPFSGKSLVDAAVERL